MGINVSIHIILGSIGFSEKSPAGSWAFFYPESEQLFGFFFVGNEAGNKVTTGVHNVAVGFYAFTT